MKILILSHSSELAGAELSMLDLFDYWTEKYGVQPEFIIRQPLKNMPKELKNRGWPYKALYYTNWSNRLAHSLRRPEDIYRNALFNTQAIFAIEKIIQHTKPDIVMTNTIVSPWAALAAYYQKVPHVWFVREYGDIDHQHIWEVGKENMLSDVGSLSNLVVTNSQTLAEHIRPYLPMANRLTTLYTPFNIDKLKAKAQAEVKNPFKADSSLKLVITGRIASTKGQAEAAKAVGELVKDGYDIELCVIGTSTDPQDSASLHQAIKDYDLAKRVHLVGHQPNPLAFVKHADVGIMASVGEAFGRVTFEYMVLGLPVVGANSGATPELIDDTKNGFLYKQGDSTDMAKKIKTYADDRELIGQHSQAAEAKARSIVKGRFGADNLYKRVSQIVADKHSVRRPIYYSHRWLEYPDIAKRYISDTHQLSLIWIIYRRTRHMAKLVYIFIGRAVRFGLRGFKRNPTYARTKKS